ncbi:MAG: transposase [Bacteroidota bacterium]
MDNIDNNCLPLHMSRNYSFKNPDALYFVSFATVHWIDVFTRESYFQVLAESLAYCRQVKGMQLFAYCIMPSHVHLLFRSAQGNPSGLLRDFKKFTAKKLVHTICTNPFESRREWLLEMFQKAGTTKSNIAQYQFWQHHNQPIA